MTTAKALEVLIRPTTGTGPARAERRKGFVPGVLYGNNETPVTLSIEEKVLVKEIHTEGFLSHLFELNLQGQKQQALVRSIQFHPVTDRPISVDFIRVNENSKITVDVPLHFINEDVASAIKLGGVVNALRHSLPLICSPHHIPEFIEIDLATLSIGSSVTLKDIAIPTNVQVSHPEKIGTVLTIVPPKVAGEASAESAAKSA